MQQISLDRFSEILKSGSMKILDVREPWETPRLEGDQVLNLPVSQIPQALDQIPRDEDVVVVCQHGIRSSSVVSFLINNHGFQNLINLQGGLSPQQ